MSGNEANAQSYSGFVVEDRVGLLSPPPDQVREALMTEFGDGAAAWYRRLHAVAPPPLLDAIAAGAIPEMAVLVVPGGYR